MTTKFRMYLKVSPPIIFTLLTGCTLCPDEEDQYAVITNTFDTDIEVRFRALTEENFEEFTATIPANSTENVFLYTWKHNDSGEVPKFRGMCEDVHHLGGKSYVDFSYDSLSQYTFCRNTEEKTYRAIPISSSCLEGEFAEAIGY